MRWRQSLNEETGKYEFIAVDDAARRHSGGSAIHGDIQSFVSPVDGSVISDRAQLREHNKRNGVVNYHEFDGAEQDKRRKERERFYTGEKTSEEKRARGMEINEIINHLERQG
jgi:hypothetical protein